MFVGFVRNLFASEEGLGSQTNRANICSSNIINKPVAVLSLP